MAVVAVSSLALLAGACGSDDTTSGDTGDTTPQTAPAQNEGQAVERFNDPSETVEVPVGQTFQITLTPDAADCYSWDLTTTDSAEVSLVTSRPSEITGTSDNNPLGSAANLDVFEFSADKVGTVTLDFQEISPCEPGDTRDTKSVSVSVVDAD